MFTDKNPKVQKHRSHNLQKKIKQTMASSYMEKKNSTKKMLPLSHISNKYVSQHR